MRRTLMFAGPAGSMLAGTIDDAPGSTGLLIVTGGTQTRTGPHRAQAMLAWAVAAAGYPVMRYDRRGVGDSSGDDPGYREAGTDLACAVAEFRKQSHNVTNIVSYGLCDAATMLAIHHADAGIGGLILANPWVVEPAGDLPPPAAIRRRYARNLMSLGGWRRLITGGVDLRRLARGIGAATRAGDAVLARRFEQAIAGSPVPTTLLLAEDDATAIAFEAALPHIARLAHVERHICATGSHSFAGPADHAWLAARIIEALGR